MGKKSRHSTPPRRLLRKKVITGRFFPAPPKARPPGAPAEAFNVASGAAEGVTLDDYATLMAAAVDAERGGRRDLAEAAQPPAQPIAREPVGVPDMRLRRIDLPGMEVEDARPTSAGPSARCCTTPSAVP